MPTIDHPRQHHQQRSHSHHPHHHSHTSPYVLLSELSCNSSSSSTSTNAFELGCCVPLALRVLLQFLHLQPGPHLLPFIKQPHCRVLHAITLEHEQPRNSTPSCFFTASLFSTDSQSHSSFPSTIFQPYWVMSSNLTWFLPAWFHMSETQQVHCQWRHRASNEGGNSSSNWILLHTLSDDLNKPLMLFKRSYTILWQWHVQYTRCV